MAPARVVETILLVDDFKPQLAAWMRECRATGKRVLCASSRAEAVAIAGREKPDLAIVDLFLAPPDSGYDVLRDLREQNPNVVLILVSAQFSVELAMRGRDVGANDCVIKPVYCKQVIDQVESGQVVAPSNEERNEDGALIDRFYDRVSRVRAEPETDPEPLMTEALDLIVELAQARLAYVELRSSTGARYERGHGCNDDDLETIRKTLSTTIIERVITSSEPLILDSAFDDARFADAGSVKQNEIRQVIVFPVGKDPTCGVVYLQGRSGEPMKPTIQARVANFARDLAPVTDRLLGVAIPLEQDAREVRRRRTLEALTRHNWNYADAAAELGVARSHLYRLVHQHGLKKPGR